MSRSAHLLVVLLCSTFLCFALTEALPGDAATALLQENATEQQIAALRERLGLDLPMPVRYLHWLGDVAHGDFGRSWRTGEAIGPDLLRRLGVSLELMLLSVLGAVLLAVPLALTAARYRGGIVDRIIAGLSLTVLSTPTFVIALLSILLFAVQLRWLPAAGFVPAGESLTANLSSLALPALTLVTAEVPAQLRVLRTELEEVLDAPYLRTARAYGCGEWQLVARRALRPASSGFVTVLGLNVAGLVAGSIIVETIFALPGMGRMLVDAVYARDVPVIQGCILFIALTYVIANLAADAACRGLDPRLRRR